MHSSFFLCQCIAARVPVQLGELECGFHQRGNAAGGEIGKTQRHRHQPNEGADGGSQVAAA